MKKSQDQAYISQKAVRPSLCLWESLKIVDTSSKFVGLTNILKKSSGQAHIFEKVIGPN